MWTLTVLLNSDILKTSYFVTQICLDRGLDSSEEQFQKDVVSVSGFTGCVWMEEQFLWKKCGFKNTWIWIDVALEKDGPQFQACNCLNTFKFYNCPLWCWQSDQLLEGQIVKKSVAGPVTAVNAWDSNFVPLSCSAEQFKVHGLTSTLVLSPVEVLEQ